MRQRRPHSEPIPIARLRPHDRAAALRVASTDAKRWANARARFAARFSVAALRVIVPLALLSSMAVFSAWSVGDRYSRSNADIERQLRSLDDMRRNLNRQLEIMNRAREYNLHLRTPIVMPPLSPYLAPIPAPRRAGSSQ